MHRNRRLVLAALILANPACPPGGSFASAAWFLPLLLWPSFGALGLTYRRMKASPI